jgi:hypothetical protein
VRQVLHWLRFQCVRACWRISILHVVEAAGQHADFVLARDSAKCGWLVLRVRKALHRQLLMELMGRVTARATTSAAITTQANAQA